MRRFAPAVVALLLLGACGSDDDGPVATDGPGDGANGAAETPDDNTGDTGDAGDTGNANGDAGAGGDCPDVFFVGTISREVDEHMDQPAGSAADDDIVDAVAWGSFGSYSVYIADHEVDRGPFEEWARGSFSTSNAVVAAEGGLLVTIPLNPTDARIEPGLVLDYADYWAGPIIDTGGGAQASVSGEVEGQVEIIAVDDDRLCFDIEYRSSNQTIEGTISAPVHSP